jgi:hypothetical protein
LWQTISGSTDETSAKFAQLDPEIMRDRRVALIGSNLDLLVGLNYHAPPRRPPEISEAGWVNGYLSPVEEGEFGWNEIYDRNEATICIVDPEGKIAAAGLTAEQVKGELGKLMGDSK